MNENKKVGKYGDEGVYTDEQISKKCTKDVFYYLNVNEPIKGWHYLLLEDGFPEKYYYDRDNCCMEESDKNELGKIYPDLNTIIIVNNNNPNDFRVIVSGDDKSQDTDGNAIERSSKNHRCVFEEKIMYGEEINPYIIFCKGDGVIDDNGIINSNFKTKFRQMMPYFYKGKPHCFNFSESHSIFKNEWNLVYIKKNSFTEKEKFEIIKNVAVMSINYYRTKLQKIDGK